MYHSGEERFHALEAYYILTWFYASHASDEHQQPRARSSLPSAELSGYGRNGLADGHAAAMASSCRQRRLRNVMTDLEELGLIRQPHTSAGAFHGSGTALFRRLAAHRKGAAPVGSRARGSGRTLLVFGTRGRCRLARSEQVLSGCRRTVKVLMMPQVEVRCSSTSSFCVCATTCC